jgi:molybdate transport system substrate-binding protein
MKEKMIFCLSLIALFVAFSASADAEEIRISAAASLTEATKEIIALYQQHHPESRLLPNFASSGALAKQISAGAPADIYISANSKWMEYLQRQQLIADASQRTLVQNQLVVVGLPNGSIDSLQKLLELSHVAICSPKTSPAGKYAEQTLTTAGVYSQLLAEQKLVLAKDVRQALLYADRGEVGAAFVYRTDALLAKQAMFLFDVPQDLYPQIVYPAALTRTGAQQNAARTFYAYLYSSEAQQILRKYAFLIP